MADRNERENVPDRSPIAGCRELLGDDADAPCDEDVDGIRRQARAMRTC